MFELSAQLARIVCDLKSKTQVSGEVATELIVSTE